MTSTDAPTIQKDSEIATLTFNRPEVNNALDTGTVAAALSVVRELQNDHRVKVLVLTGVGKAFIADADIAEMRLGNRLGQSCRCA